MKKVFVIVYRPRTRTTLVARQCSSMLSAIQYRDLYVKQYNSGLNKLMNALSGQVEITIQVFSGRKDFRRSKYGRKILKEI